jgi:hypothetical protein
MSDGGDLSSSSVADLLAGYAKTLAELRRRGVLRTNNAPAGDYAEWLVQRTLGGVLAPNSEKSHDVTLEDGRTVQVKARVVSSPPRAGETQTSPFRSWSFDLGAFVLLDASSYQPVLGVLVPVDSVRIHAKPRPHVNGDIVFIQPPLTTSADAVDITAELRSAASSDLGGSSMPTPAAVPRLDAASGTPPATSDRARVADSRASAGRRTWHDDEIRVLVAFHHMYGPRGGGRTNLRPLCRLFGLAEDEVNKLERQGDSINYVLGGPQWSASEQVRRLASVPRERAIEDGQAALERLRHAGSRPTDE